MQSTAEIKFTQQQDMGLLILSGVIDIFEAEHLLDTARQAAKNAEVQTLHLDMAAVERLDISTIQILMALKTNSVENARTFNLRSISSPAAQALETLGVTL